MLNSTRYSIPSIFSDLKLLRNLSFVNQTLEIIYQDEHLVAINKPHGLLVHPSSIAREVKVTALHLLKGQLNKYLYAVHRLDRKTSGVLLFTFDRDTLVNLRKAFDERTVVKRYVAIVRGHFQPADLYLDHNLINENGISQDAVTSFRCLGHSEIRISSGRYKSSRYSLIECYPKTGRFHQIRKHLAHLRHPIIGDRPHGCNKQNRFFKEQWNMMTMLLHARELRVQLDDRRYEFKAQYSKEFMEMASTLNLLPFLND